MKKIAAVFIASILLSTPAFALPDGDGGGAAPMPIPNLPSPMPPTNVPPPKPMSTSPAQQHCDIQCINEADPVDKEACVAVCMMQSVM